VVVRWYTAAHTANAGGPRYSTVQYSAVQYVWCVAGQDRAGQTVLYCSGSTGGEKWFEA
jgi:hypothetical protein